VDSSPRLDASASDLALIPDGKTLATATGGTVNLWELKTRTSLGNLRGSWYSGIFVDFGLKGRAIVAASSDGLRLWQPK